MRYYVGFSTRKRSFISRLIKLVEGSEFSHVYLKYYIPEYNEWAIYHASSTLIHLIPEHRFLERNNIVYEYEFTASPGECRQMVKSSFNKLGVPYAWFQIIGMLGIRILKLWFNWRVRNPFGDGERSQVCSELVYYSLKDHINFEGFEPEWDGPKKLHQYIERAGTLVEK